MERRDHLKKQIDMLGMVIAKMLALLTGKKQSPDFAEILSNFEQTLTDAALPELNAILNSPVDELGTLLKDNYQFSYENLNAFADVLTALSKHFASNGYTTRAIMLSERSIALYDYSQQYALMYDLAIQNKKKEAAQQLELLCNQLK